MDIRCDATIPFPRPVVFAAYRDRLTELVPFLPNIRGIHVESRQDEGKVARLVNVWHGGGEIPTIARAVLSENVLSWHDHATWLEESWTCQWRVEPHAFKEAVTSSGVNTYLETGGQTRLEIRGGMTIEGAKLPGVPRLIAGKVGQAVEEFMVKMISKNLLDVSAGLTRFLQERQRQGTL
jgi:hypothetical protein